jgi:sigma-B regulation protein RsbU (phosphoserine phosphatase)
MVSTIQTTGELGEGAAHSLRRFVFPARISLMPDAREHFVVFLTEIGVVSTERDMLALGLTEVLTNAIKHGCDGDASKSITVEWWNDDSQVTLVVGHEGGGPADEIFEAGALPEDPLSTSGRGSFLIRQLFDDCRLWRSADSVRIELRKEIQGLDRAGEAIDDMALVLEELSHSYESLAAFQRMGNVLITAKRDGEFLEEGMQSLRQIHNGRPPEILWLCLSDAVLDSVQADLGEVDGVVKSTQTPPLVQRVIDSGDSFIWDSKEFVADDETFSGHSHGCIFPIVARGEELGCVVSALRDGGDGFDSSEINNLRTFTDLFGIALANANTQTLRRRETRAVRELELAAEIQKMLLPLTAAPQSEHWSLCMQHRSAQEVAGDYLEARYDGEGNLLMTVIDVMGKGVSAAMLASVYRTAFLMNLSKPQRLDELANSLNSVLASQLGELSMFVTCALVRIDPKMEWMEIVNAGHCPVLTFDEDGLVEQIEASGPPLGIFEDSEYEVERRRIRDHETVLLVTDGLFEWQHDDRWWGWDRFVALASRKAFHDPLGLWEDIQNRISVTDGELHDDQTLLCWKNTSVSAAKSAPRQESAVNAVKNTAANAISNSTLSS